MPIRCDCTHNLAIISFDWTTWAGNIFQTAITKSPTYIDLLRRSIVPICKFNYGQSFWFQQDNSRIHTARIVKEYMTESHFPVLPWPSRSQNLNIIENIWKMLEDIIYDRSLILSLIDLKEEIQKAFLVVNESKRRSIINLYERPSSKSH